MNKPPPDDPLDALLDRWSSIPPPSPHLSAQVWQRIATSQEGTWDPAGRGPWVTFTTWLERPVFALGFVAACALLGLFLAEVRVGQLHQDRNAQLAKSYLQLIDPLLSTTDPESRS